MCQHCQAGDVLPTATSFASPDDYLESVGEAITFCTCEAGQTASAAHQADIDRVKPFQN